MRKKSVLDRKIAVKMYLTIKTAIFIEEKAKKENKTIGEVVEEMVKKYDRIWKKDIDVFWNYQKCCR